jgi:two-component system NarL family sensor kinase
MTHPSLDRADAALAETVGQLREAVFELHPYVLEEAGLEAAVRAVAQRAAARGGFDLRLAVRSGNGHPGDQLVFSAARELLSNVLEHANATHVTVELGDVDGDLRLVVEDDGEGFPRERLAQRLAAGHVGIASQRVRIEAAGGSMDVASTPGSGTRVEVRVPAA